MGGGTETFPDLGRHCQKDDCRQLDFLPFNCDGCQKMFCVEHRTYGSHDCPKADHNSRIVLVCEVCSMSIEKKGDEEDEDILMRHKQFGNCDPAKKHKPKCPVTRCKEKLTVSNTSTCKTCHQKLCLKHRFPTEHSCKPASVKETKFLLALAARGSGDCREKQHTMPSAPSIKAC